MEGAAVTIRLGRCRRAGPALLLLAACGCGLGDYEGKMTAAQERLKRFEEEFRLLDGPLSVPTVEVKGSRVPVANLFLRPPRGIATQADNENDPRGRLLYTFRARSGPFAWMELAFGGDEKEFAS